jgi:hypothetical protein
MRAGLGLRSSASVSTSRFSPLYLSPALWLDASDTSTITESSGAVSEWRDRSVNAKHATQGTGTSQPSYILAAQNGLNAIRFDGSNDVLSISSLTISGSFTIALAIKVTNRGLVYEHSVNANNNEGSYLYAHTNSSSLIRRGGNRTARDVGTDWLNTSTWSTVTQQHNGTNISNRLWRNSVEQTMTNVVVNNAGTASTTQTLYIGQRTGNVAPMSGDIGEFIIFNSALSTEEIALVEQYLNAKWAVY